MTKSREILAALHAKGFQCAAPYHLNISMLIDLGAPEAQLKSVYREAVSRYPEYHNIYFAMSRHFEPKWGGSAKKFDDFVNEVAELGTLPVVNFAAGGIATPADAALMMQLGVDGVFVGSGIFKSSDPAKRAAAIVKATTYYKDSAILAEVSRSLGDPMVGRSAKSLSESELLAVRGS